MNGPTPIMFIMFSEIALPSPTLRSSVGAGCFESFGESLNESFKGVGASNRRTFEDQTISLQNQEKSTVNTSGNTILITGGGSGIGRGLAEALHSLGNQVIIAGRRKSVLDETTSANPGIKSATLNIEDPDAIQAFAAQVENDYPALNVVIHNAGIMRPEDLKSPNLADAEAIIAINLLGPMRLNGALLPLLLKQPHATVMTVSSGLAYVPLALTPTYCATKAAIHSWTQSLRHHLKDTNVEVLEIIPPYVQTELTGPKQAADPRAMPLKDYIAETIEILKTQPTPPEICVKRVESLRGAAERGEYDEAFTTINSMSF
jgi:uncharacterized oxidoreductase